MTRSLDKGNQSKRDSYGSSVGLVPFNALVLTGLANFGVVGYPETEPHRRRFTSFLESEISQTHIRLLLPFLP